MNNKILIGYYPFNSGCRLGNQLYFALNCFKIRKLNPNVYMSVNSGLAQMLTKLNICYFQISNVFNAFAYNIAGNESGHLKLFQTFGTCYSKELLNEFISSTVLKSELGKKIIVHNNAVALNIRAGDYLTASPDYTFNFMSFLRKSIQSIDLNENFICHVFSDDIPYCKEKYSDVLHSYFKQVEFIDTTDPVTDLVVSSMYYTKIIWNSTYAYWSAYISNCLFGNERQIFVPDYHCRTCNNMKAWQLNPDWNIISGLK